MAVVIVVVSLLFVARDDPSRPRPPRDGFYVSDGRLYDANHTDFVMRGVGHAHSIYSAQTAAAVADIKAVGANTVRVELSTGALRDRNGAADVASVISLCKARRLICVLGAYDTTGWGERDGAIPQNRAVDYWLSVQKSLTGEEKYIIINVANEPYGLENYETWLTDTVESIHRLRQAGFRHTLMVDAPDWGQDWSFTMRDNAATAFQSDPQRNTVFSIHMYGAFDRAPKVIEYLRHYVDARLPIVVGEFGFLHSDGQVDEDTIMAEAQRHDIGYLGWSWSGNGGDVSYLDLVSEFNAESLTPWGERLFFGRNGIRHTSREASVYSGSAGPRPDR
jgi:mannan endo-1,4-beta-mannosidase